MKTTMGNIRKLGVLAVGCLLPSLSFARDLQYSGGEATIYVKPGEPTQVSFPGKIAGGYKNKSSAVKLERNDNFIVVFAQQNLALEGESILVHLGDKRSYSLRVVPATGGTAKDDQVKVIDSRASEVEEEITQEKLDAPRTFSSPATIPGLMREMVLTAEFGKRKGIPGYRRSNAYAGETVLDDGSVVAKVDEIFMGSDLWGYVLSVENKLDTTVKLNPATFRLDGTRAVSFDRGELSPRPVTGEQQLAAGHRGKVYIVTKSKRR